MLSVFSEFEEAALGLLLKSLSIEMQHTILFLHSVIGISSKPFHTENFHILNLVK